AGAEQEDLGVEELLLALDVHLGEEEVALVAVALLGGEAAGRLPLPALVLPLVEAAGHRDDVLVAELGQRLRRERGADAGGAVDDDLRRLVRHPALDGALEGAAGDVERAGDGPLLVLLGLADVEDQRARLLAQGIGLVGLDLADLGLGGGQELTEVRHGWSFVVAGGRKPTDRVNNQESAGIPSTSAGSSSPIGPRKTT